MLSSLEPQTFWTGAVLGITGLLAVLCGAMESAAPARMHTLFKDFARSRIPAWVLTAIAVFWCAWIVWNAELGRFSFFRPFIWPGAVFAYWAIIRFLDEMLAPRAFGALLTLLGQPILMAIRWAETPWRVLVVLLVYVWIIIGAALILNPWYYRLAMEKILPTPRAVRIHGIIRLLCGILLAGIGAAIICSAG